MSLSIPAKPSSARCFPRVSGDEPLAGLTADNTNWFSPRERG